ncbi:hypothetical protein TM7x_02330 [Candidatus Nanosynbacter lyticus]|uniref:Uncharacterized protein n=1 Tax=Candidatus Nanosynbacter lyticus TaxID=2093824 RepID=A0A6S4GSA4_9BACT|nr:hypothetical protein [Candidatus Nanosynbacter lyticus]AJA06842.1 hypothetical protein TM7x_02330 [Candidatus Nanosynbacter lyticus]QCT41601.1 hypothetical protein FBF38_02320 [TM7 phylum sp. oral taxon 952]
MSERRQSGYVVEGKLPQAEDHNKKYISQIIDYVEFIIKHVPFLVEGEELRGEYQEAYENILELFRQIEEEYNRLPDCIEIDFDIEEVKESLRSIFNGTYEKFIRENLSVVFPKKLAKVNIPEFCQAEEYAIPDVIRWQYANKIISPELADSEYMRFIAEARKAVTDSLTKDGAFGLPDDFTITRPEYIPGNDDKMKFSSFLEDFKCRKLKEVEDKECNGINPEDDLKFAKSVLKFIKSIKLPSEEELAKQYKEATVKENSPAVRSLAESMAKERLREALDDALRVLSEKLNGYEVAPEIAGESLRKATKKKRSNKPKSRAEEDSRPVEIGLKAGDAVILDSETFPWLKEDSIVDVLHVECGGDGTVVAVIDARTEEAKKIEHKMTGYENDEKKRDILPIIKDKLTMAAKYVATSEDKSVGLPVGLNNRLKELYPFIIYAWKDQTHNAKRVYVSKVSVEDMPDESETKKSLQKAGVTEIVLFLGACDKQNQEPLVALFIDGNSRDAAKYGAGA